MSDTQTQPTVLPEITIVDNIADQPEIGQEVVNNMTVDERMKVLHKYRELVREGHEITVTLNGNALRILRASRAKSIADNPRAKAGAKKKAAIGTLDILGFQKAQAAKKEG